MRENCTSMKQYRDLEKEEPIRILQVVGKMSYGGMETLIMNVYRNIDRNKVQFDFLVHYPEAGEYDEEIKRLGGKIYYMPRTKISNYFIYKKAIKKFFAEHHEFSAVHGHLHNLAFVYMPIAKKYDIECIMHLHNNSVERNIKGKIGYFCTRMGISSADYVFACSESAAQFYLQGKYNNVSYKIIRNGIDTNKFSYNELVRQNMRKEYQCENKFVVLHVGRFFEQKNHRFLIEIFKEIVEQEKESVLFMIGVGPLKEGIEKQVKDLGLEKQVCFLDAKSNVNEWMQMADCFLLPSLYEGLGIVLIEAQTSGLRCITTKEKVAKETKITKNIEYLSLGESAKEWADKILATNKENRESCDEQVRKAGFDIKDTAKWLENWYLKG